MKLSPTPYQMHVFASFSDLFPEEKVPSVEEIVRHFSRATIIKIACALGQFYGDGDINCFEHFFSPRNYRQWEDIKMRFERFEATTAFPNTKYYVSSFVTGLELLRHSFALPSDPQRDTYPDEQSEWQLFRAILVINQNTICKFSSIQNLNRYQLVYLNNLCYVDIGNDLSTLLIQQLFYSFSFFTFLEHSSDKSRSLLRAFENHYSSTWKQYIKTILSLYINGEKNRIHLFPKNEKGSFNHNILSKISISPASYFKYASDNQTDRSGNSDYRFFRESPLIDRGESYVLHSPSIVLGKLYNSLFFDLSQINNSLPKKQRTSNVFSLFQEDFIQNELLFTLAKQLSNKRSILCTEEIMAKNNPKRHDNELGPPDLLIKSHKHIILFECKDIRLNGWIKEQKDYELIIQELEGKIIGTQGNHKGIGQLCGHLKSIRDGQFRWEKISEGKKVYPVLILSDPTIIQNGLYGIVRDKYEQLLQDKKVRNIAANRPLILMSVFTLFKYSNEFIKKGLAFYFEQFYQYINVTKQKEVSFDQYMGWHHYNIKKQIGKIMSELKG